MSAANASEGNARSRTVGSSPTGEAFDVKDELYFCTAENADLKKRLDTSMGEVLELDKENKDLKEHKVKTSIALTLLDRLKQEHPEIYREVISQKKKPTTREKKNWWTK